MRPTLLLALLPLLGCPFQEPINCDTMAVASVVVDVTAEDGADIDPTVEFSRDGDTFEPCDDAEADDEFICGWEIEGELTVRVSADGYAPFEETVTVEADECHVTTENLAVTLTPA